MNLGSWLARLFSRQVKVSTVSHKVGWHIGNTVPWDAGDESIMQSVPPKMVTFITGEGFWPTHMEWILNEVNPDCHFCFRPYFPPSDNPIAYQNYLDSVESMLDQPTWDFIPPAQRHLQIFNEQNMPRWSQWEGFGDTVEDMERFNEWFCRGYEQLSGYGFKIGWTPLTIGNRDVCFPDVDALNVPYYMHGPEAAKVNPTPGEIQAAILSGPCYDSLMMADEYYAHIYCINSPEISIYEPWYGLRFAEYAKFFPKPYDVWINENGIGLPPESWGLWYDLLNEYDYVKGTSIWILHHLIPDASHEIVRYLHQYIESQPPPPEPPPVDFEEELRNHAWNYEGKFQPNIPYNPDAAFQRYARDHGLGIPMSGESDVSIGGILIRFQCFSGAIVYTEVPHWDQTAHLAW
jgi:hypothetical protein